MPPLQQDRLGRQGGEGFDSSKRGTRIPEGIIRVGDGTQRLRNEESWVEISSRPSSSSLSSVGDEIVTTGLRVQQDPNLRRRKRPYLGSPSRMALSERQTSSSSQEEYDESESEEDRVLASSNEHIPSSSGFNLMDKGQLRDAGAESTDDENATALGRVSEAAVFTPQPNVFSHPPSVQNSQRQPVTGPSYTRSSNPPQSSRQSYSGRFTSRPQPSNSPYNTLSPSHQADRDAALRASLTTLLSCAAAARGLPKRSQNSTLGANTVARPEFTGIRLVPESELTGTPPATSSPSSRSQSSPSVSEKDVNTDKGKRNATNTKPNVPPRATKKKKMTVMEEAVVSPTLLTWVVSASVVVLVSVVGFSAGYAIGKEVGRQETLNGLTASENSSCGKEAARQLSEIRKFRWSNGRGIVA